MLVFVNKLFISVQLIFLLDHVLLLAELAQKFKFFKITVWQAILSNGTSGDLSLLIGMMVWKKKSQFHEKMLKKWTFAFLSDISSSRSKTKGLDFYFTYWPWCLLFCQAFLIYCFLYFSLIIFCQHESTETWVAWISFYHFARDCYLSDLSKEPQQQN